MRPIAIDITRLIGRALKGTVPTGIDRVGLAYVDHVRRRARALVRIGRRPIVATRASSERLFACLLEDSLPTPRGRLRLLEAASRVLPETEARVGAVMLHTGHGGLEKPGFLRRWRTAGGINVVFVHDLIPITHAEYARAGERAKHEARMLAVIAEGSAVIANSAATAEALRRFADRHRLPLPRVIVAHLGAASLPAPSPVRPMAAPYFVCVGTIEARKNHALLLEVWRRLVEMRGPAAPKLVLLGQRGWECEHVFDLLERCESLRGVVEHRPGVTDSELATYLHHAQASLLPSFVEGFGLPLIEGLAAGVPVIASALAVFRELAGELPVYVDPLDGPGWLTRIEELTDPATRARIAAQLQGFRAPSWGEHFAKVDALLETLQ